MTPGPLQSDYRFTGQRFDEGLSGGLYDYIARHYDPTLARFIQPDTIVPAPGDPQSLNRYAYTGNNPVRYTDPSGHRYIAPRPDPKEVPNPGPEILLPPSHSPTGDPMQAYWSEIESWDPGTTAEFVSVVVSPFTAPLLGIISEAAIGDLAIPTAQALWWKLLSWAGLACADGDCGNEVRSAGEYVRQTLPKLEGSIAEAFEGEPVVRTLKPGTILYRSEALSAERLGFWFGTQPTQSTARAERWWNIVKWVNPREVLRTYEVTQELTVYYGKVAGGRGTQILVPRDVPLDEVLHLVDQWSLK